MVGWCFRAIQSPDPTLKLRIYRTYILPGPNYASPIWSLYLRQKVNELKSLKRRFTKHLIEQAQHTYGERLRNLSLLSLESQRELTDYVMTYKLCHNMIDITLKDAGLTLSTNNTKDVVCD